MREQVTPSQVQEAGGFPIIYADPPWSYQDKACIGAAETQYGTMRPEAIRALPVAQLAAKDAVLFLWATYPKIEEALALIPAWGFTYKSIAFQWVKYYKGGTPFFGLGRWTRGNTEPCLLAVKGKPKRIHNGVSQLIESIDDDFDGAVLQALVGRHSAKPPEVRDRIVTLMGDVPRLEMFARSPTPGWDVWGNEVETDLVIP